MPLWIPPVLAFLAGSIPFGLLIAKAKGVNIREHGSGNIGATNVLRVVGKPYGIGCLILDLLKGLIPTLIGISLIRYAGSSNPMAIDALKPYAVELPILNAQILQILTGLAAIIGHNYSPWIGFKGGKGIATSGGVLIALMPAAVVILVLIWLILFFTTKYVSVASIGAALCLPILTIGGSAFHGKLADGTWNKPLFVFSIVVALMAVWRHRSNIVALKNGTENKFSKKKKK
ncbi:glycerol-3-phosphate 1-O-acyltransferase PlsY [Verrucomicrobiaceae bacterium R5-34]|uniref:Glycerol-3-phosphate acyltransferase n=1 Tax=Oceaniferula flava TaxID=2800421 RepID=A0AAE2SBR3_9BACT|nr:glycerol-3-phosphate 1-O-acyltransferase PlsY [Oceaniferula flavus]MBK1829120.1 glycerol-3-phosphate 1-O-acyltransferase PlsY [Verrucomicrobiaceae bacterium R5-34]MBK1853356.1 glycerol-3-phosphate 1-O-acyltransferase PlsY [Oceaniferula flavus]MBM1134661.1 glycerol-3-phosphate 1-O-acyltransferase PlsY [Oceaniferula flavus]